MEDLFSIPQNIPYLKGRYSAWFAGLLFVVALVITVVVWLISPVQSGGRDYTQFTVEQGQGTRTIAAGLKDEHLIRSSTVFVLYTRLMGIQSDLKTGTYVLGAGMTTPQIADIIAGGRGLSDDIEVTIPEGVNVWEADQILVSAGLIMPGELRSRFSFKEGHLFPDTYRFAKDATVQDIVNRMEANFMEKAKTRSDITVIIASMLEKEAKTPQDMAMVAGIIEKRTELSMPLQIDATVGYGWCLRVAGVGKRCDVTQAPVGTEIKVDGPYNTYTRKGLPQGAISNPGSVAIQAAAKPTKSDYLYYLSTRDGSKLIYSKTLAEHLQNRQKYLGF